MTSVQEHEENVKELLDDISEKIRAGLLMKRQKLVGFAASEAATNLFAIFLHKNDLISAGFNVNHRFFASYKRANDVFTNDFAKKKELLTLLVEQESFRDKLCYGKAKNEDLVNAAVKNLFSLKTLIEQLTGKSL